MKRLAVPGRVLVGLFAAVLTYGQAPSRFELLAKFRGLGGMYASTVGPGPAAGGERLYLSYLYLANTVDVVAVDPATGDAQVFRNPAEGEHGARCMTVGPDGNIYLGTLPRAHFLKLDVKAGKLIDLGRPSKTEKFIWDVAFGADGKLYGGTYPGAKLLRYDPATGALEDLGRMDPTEHYAHYVAGSDDGFMYAGIGYSRANITAYEIATGKHRGILPAGAQVTGQAVVYRGTDGKVYGSIAGRYFRLSGWIATPVSEAEAQRRAANRLRDGRTVEVRGNTLRVHNPKTGASETRTFSYEGNSLPLLKSPVGMHGCSAPTRPQRPATVSMS
ncbi:MAG TPA: hypothetical protein VFQ79_12890 [Bryobacteraceae bacterium]|nr:hypothetical protein [Bryobacteraceae bacterium]